jgi:hypothetical protein
MKKDNHLQSLSYVLIPALALALTGCGTTSKLKTTQGNTLQSIQKYRQVSVLRFADKTNGKESGDKMREHGEHFADLIAVELDRTKAFEKVDRGDTAQPGSLVISGDITRCVEGNSSLRYWIGLGAGSSYFDATLRCSDADSGQQIGEIIVDKNSWALGGGLAAGQTVQKFMEGAAKKAASQLAEAKKGAANGK